MKMLLVRYRGEDIEEEDIDKMEVLVLSAECSRDIPPFLVLVSLKRDRRDDTLVLELALLASAAEFCFGFTQLTYHTASFNLYMGRVGCRSI